MSAGVLMDAGPLVAYFVANEARHDWAVETFKTISRPALTCEAVLTEACFLIGRRNILPARLLAFLARDDLRIGIILSEELNAVRALMERYVNVPMSLADACLVRMAEISGLPICTLDGDFAIYRAHGRRPLELISPVGRHGLHEP